MRFEKVSYRQYLKDIQEDVYYTGQGYYLISDIIEGHMNFSGVFQTLINFTKEEIYDQISLPRRATKKSAGYDFFAPYDFKLAPGETIKISTGIRVLLDDDKCLICAPRSGHGFKARLQLNNTIGVIDADYSDSSNEGHIMFKLTNDSNEGKYITVKQGEAFAQAIITRYYTVEDDNQTATRDGGFGSTNK